MNNKVGEIVILSNLLKSNAFNLIAKNVQP